MDARQYPVLRWWPESSDALRRKFRCHQRSSPGLIAVDGWWDFCCLYRRLNTIPLGTLDKLWRCRSFAGLFHRYITQSGSALISHCKQPLSVSLNYTIQLAKSLGCSIRTSEAIVDCLKTAQVSELVRANSMFTVWNGYPKIKWAPTLEPDIEGAMLTDTPRNLVAAGKNRDLPWIASVTRDEGNVYGSSK